MTSEGNNFNYFPENQLNKLAQSVQTIKANPIGTKGVLKWPGPKWECLNKIYRPIKNLYGTGTRGLLHSVSLCTLSTLPTLNQQTKPDLVIVIDRLISKNVGNYIELEVYPWRSLLRNTAELTCYIFNYNITKEIELSFFSYKCYFKNSW